MKVVHTFVLDWRDGKNANDKRRDLSVANYKYDDDYVLWAKGKSDTEESAKLKDQDPTQAQKKNKTIHQPNGIL